MSDIGDLENRISAAMDRIGRGLEALSAPVAETGGGEEAEALQRALEDEKLAGAQLEERVRSLSLRVEELEAAVEAAKAAQTEAEAGRDAAEAAKGAAETALAAAQKEASEAAAAVSEDDLAASREAMGELAQRLRRMKRLSRNVRANNEQLRAAAEAGVTDPALINESLKAELESLKATRETELIETDAILAGLRPMLGGVDAATADETEAEPMGEE